MIILSDSRERILNSRDPNHVPKIPLKNLFRVKLLTGKTFMLCICNR